MDLSKVRAIHKQPFLILPSLYLLTDDEKKKEEKKNIYIYIYTYDEVSSSIVVRIVLI